MMILAALAAGIAVAAFAASFAPGAYTAVGEGGHGGPITVSVVFDASRMVSITVTEHNETPTWANMTFPTMTARMIEAQTWDVDIIGGATYSSTALRNAVRLAMQQASN
jgi:uncharacterized protein with FMN-binding domain